MMAQRIDVIPLMHTMEIILTNGVSFSLVAGACCIVKFSYSLTKESLNSSVTLNINSTGAKKFRSYTKTYVGGTDSLGWRDMQLNLDVIPIVMYNGSTWENTCYAAYGDYND